MVPRSVLIFFHQGVEKTQLKEGEKMNEKTVRPKGTDGDARVLGNEKEGRGMNEEKQTHNPADYYKCGLLRWSKTPLLSRMTLIVSTVALVVSFVVLCMKG